MHDERVIFSVRTKQIWHNANTDNMTRTGKWFLLAPLSRLGWDQTQSQDCDRDGEPDALNRPSDVYPWLPFCLILTLNNFHGTIYLSLNYFPENLTRNFYSIGPGPRVWLQWFTLSLQPESFPIIRKLNIYKQGEKRNQWI